MSLLDEHIAKHGSNGLNKQIINKASSTNKGATGNKNAGGTSLLEEHIAKHGSEGLNGSVIGGNASSTAKKTTSTKKEPGQINAFGAGDYGTKADTRLDNIIRSAGYLSAAGITKLASLLSGGTGELTMGQSAQAAIKGQNQQEAEAEKKARQDSIVKPRLNEVANTLNEIAQPYKEKATAPLSENNAFVKFTKSMANGELTMGESAQAAVKGKSQQEAEAEKKARQQKNITGESLGRLVGELGINAGQMAMDALSGPAALVTMGARAAGSRALELEAQGKSENQQLLGGLTSGMIEILTEKIGGPFERIYGKTALGGITSKFVKSLGKSKVGRAALKLLTDFASEGAEEVLSDVLNPIVDKLTGISEEDWSWENLYGDDWAEQWAHDFLTGGILGLGGGGLSIGTSAIESNAQYAKTGKTIANVNGLVDAAQSMGGKAAKLAEEVSQKSTDIKLGKLYDQVQKQRIEMSTAARLQELGAQNASETAEAIVEELIGDGGNESLLEPKAAQRALNELSDAINGNDFSSNMWAIDTLQRLREFNEEIFASPVLEIKDAEAETTEAPEEDNEPLPPLDAAEETAEAETEETISEQLPAMDRAEQEAFLRERYAEQLKNGTFTEATIRGMMEELNDGILMENLLGRADKYVKGIENNEGRDNEKGNDVSDGVEKRDTGRGAGVEARKLQRGSETGRTLDQSRRGVQRQNLVADLRLEKVSPRELGLEKGTEQKTLTVIPEEAYDDELNEVSEKVYAETGIRPTFVLGGMYVFGVDDEEHRVRGAFTGDKIIVQADHIKFTATQIAMHEVYHFLAREHTELNSAIEETITEQYSEEQLNKVLMRYIEAERGVIDLEGDEEAVYKVLEELFADIYAGMSRFGSEAFTETVRSITEERTGQMKAQPVEVETKAQAPPVKEEKAEAFAAEEKGETVTEEAKTVAEKAETVAEKPKTVTEKKQSESKLDDFGEKIGGARKDIWSKRGLLSVDLDEMNEREREKNVKKDNVWKRPDYRKLVENGGNKGLLYAANEIRKSLNQNITYSRNASEERKIEEQKLFIDTVREIQAMAERATTAEDFSNMGFPWLIENGYVEPSGSRFKYTHKWYSNPALQYTDYHNTVSRLAKNFDKLNDLAERDNFAAPKSEGIPKGFTILDNITTVGSNEKTWGIAKGPYIIKAGFSSYDEALKFLKSAVATKKKKTRFVPQQLLKVHRKGPDYRDSRNVTGQSYIDAFNFKGGEFGNWMSEKDRQVSLNYGYDALMDLAAALDIDNTDISFNGNLNIAFGARGQGLSGAAAHYERDRHVINLTKMHGAGALAHEWFHALDDFIGGYSSNYASDKPAQLPEESREAMRKLITTMQYRDSTAEETDLAAQKRTEQAERSVEYAVSTQFPWVQKLENGKLTDADTRYYSRKPTEADAAKYHELLDKLKETGDSKLVGELSALRKDIVGRVIPKEDRDSISMRLYSLKPEARKNVQAYRVRTDYYNNSRKFGDMHAKDGDYWDSTIEMAARAFACYIADKTGKNNDYLSAHSDSAVAITLDSKGNPEVVKAFPEGEERIAINAAFDELISALKNDGLLHERRMLPRGDYAEVSYSIDDAEDSYSADDATITEEELLQTVPEAPKYTAESTEKARQTRTERIRNKPREEFEGTEAINKLGIKIEGSIGNYAGVENLEAENRARRETERRIRQTERRLKPTDAEILIASGLAEGTLTEWDIPAIMDMSRIEQLAGVYADKRSLGYDPITRRRQRIYNILDEKVENDWVDKPEYTPAKFGKLSKIVMNERQPERVIKSIFGKEDGTKLYNDYFRTVEVNEAERLRFINRNLDKVRTFKDKSGKERALTKDEDALVQRTKEGRAIAEQVAAMQLGKDFENAIQALRKSKQYLDYEQSKARTKQRNNIALALNKQIGADEMLRQAKDLVIPYARWLDTQEQLKNADTVIIENAVKVYDEMYNDLYAAINDFLIAHGYPPIGFRKGYAPHMQTDGVQTSLVSALKSIGVNTEVVGSLPADIAGETANFKPNMRYNPYFQTRRGDFTEYSITKGFESYIAYISDVFYHTDDIMRLRRAEQQIRRAYAAENIQDELATAEGARNESLSTKAVFLTGRVEGITSPTQVSAESADTLLEKYISSLYEKVTNQSRYSEFVTWLDNYINMQAGKQSLADRGLEYSGSRELLNFGNKLMRRFSETNIGGNLSTVLNQTAQYPIIKQHIGAKYVRRAIKDICSGDIRKGSFIEKSDHLTGKTGIKWVTMDNYDKFLNVLFSPAEFADRVMNLIAVRGEYLRLLDKGMSENEAMREADAFGRRAMASRLKGVRPQGFESKRFISQMIHVFTLEAANTVDYTFMSDLPTEIRNTFETEGSAAGYKKLAVTIVAYLLSAFLLNRLDDELYGGTPIPFDLLGITATFFAEGKGLSTNTMLKTIIDNGLEKIFGERLLGTDDFEEGFDFKKAREGVSYDVTNDIPYLSNLLGIAGYGDNALPTVGINEAWKEVKNAWAASAGSFFDKEAKFDAWEAFRSSLFAAAQLLPGGRQLRKTVQGTEALIEGGVYSGSGDNRRLKYSVDWSLGKALQAILFGTSALTEAEDFYASGNSALSPEQTTMYYRLVSDGADGMEIYDTIMQYRKLSNDESLTAYERGLMQRNIVCECDISDEQKLDLYNTLSGASTRIEHFKAIMKSGLSFDETATIYDQYELIKTDEEATASEKATEFAYWVDQQGFTTLQEGTIKDEFKYFSIVPTEAGRYEKFTDVGISPDISHEINDRLSTLEPEDGRTSPSTLQKVNAIAYMTIPESAKEAAMKVVTSEKAYERYMIARSCGVSSVDYADFLEILDRVDVNGGNPSKANFKEAVERSDFNRAAAAQIWGTYWTKSSPW